MVHRHYRIDDSMPIRSGPSSSVETCCTAITDAQTRANLVSGSLEWSVGPLPVPERLSVLAWIHRVGKLVHC